MESPTPMDRLLCGDVGYGKTEVAMRAAFKAVMDGKQVAVLAPTTVLAFQHLKTLRERFAAFPVRIDMVSRFRTKAEQKQTLEDLAAGKVDIIVGTHRLLSKDVVPRPRPARRRRGAALRRRAQGAHQADAQAVDVLTMTATPIPRTLNMSLVGIRDMSIIETPPRTACRSRRNVVKFDQDVIRARSAPRWSAAARSTSSTTAWSRSSRWATCSAARAGGAHRHRPRADGRGRARAAMVDFVAHKFDVLLATTIIENGLDIPNANTIIINRADRYGLSQLYQLRGRVGRSDRRPTPTC
jgi:transcription-repair coupling factor (superfamily II helicase)